MANYEQGRYDGLSWYDTETAYIPCSATIINATLLNMLCGNTGGAVEYFADVKYGDSLTALPLIDSISIEREMGQIMGTLHCGCLSDSFPISGLNQGALVTVDLGVRFGGVTAAQKAFHGRIKKMTNPSDGASIRGYFDAFDGGRELVDAGPGVGDNTGANATNLPPQITGDVLAWLQRRVLELPLEGIIVRSRTSGITAPAGTLLAYPSLRDAAKAMVNAYTHHYSYFTGSNELVILDADTLSSETVLFALGQKGILKKQKIDSLLDRYNRVPYQKVGTTSAASVYWVDDDGVMHQDAASETDTVTGTYNDATDQASYPILTSDTLRNDILTTTAEFDTLAASVCVESQRERYDLQIRFNPFIDLGDVITMDSSRWFVYRLRHDIEPGRQWQTRIEVRKL